MNVPYQIKCVLRKLPNGRTLIIGMCPIDMTGLNDCKATAKLAVQICDDVTKGNLGKSHEHIIEDLIGPSGYVYKYDYDTNCKLAIYRHQRDKMLLARDAKQFGPLHTLATEIAGRNEYLSSAMAAEISQLKRFMADWK